MTRRRRESRKKNEEGKRERSGSCCWRHRCALFALFVLVEVAPGCRFPKKPLPVSFLPTAQTPIVICFRCRRRAMTCAQPPSEDSCGGSVVMGFVGLLLSLHQPTILSAIEALFHSSLDHRRHTSRTSCHAHTPQAPHENVD